MPSFVKALTPSQDQYLQLLIRQANQKQISESRYWLLLLHYRSGVFGARSEIEDPNFFNSKEGMFDPQSELEATLQAFFNPPPDNDQTLHKQCQFVARYSWLKTQLQFNPNLLPEIPCPRYEGWIKRLNPESINLIFPGSRLTAPATIFGHTSLVLNTKGREDFAPLNYNVTYGAVVNPEAENPIKYALWGIFGGYTGVMQNTPYYIKIQEYNDIEGRDIWEYELNLTPEEIERLMKHFWELRFVRFRYFFFLENCSYQLLSLLEAAKPEYQLRERFNLWAAPVDTVREVLKIPGILKQKNYRPSRLHQAQAKFQSLSSAEKEFARRVYDDETLVDSSEWNQQDPRVQATILETLSDKILLREDKKQQKNRWRQLLRKRSQIPYQSQNSVQQPDFSYEQGHETSKFTTSLGRDLFSQKNFLNLQYRASYHGLADFPQGYDFGASIKALETDIRIDDTQILLDRFLFLELMSFIPRDDFVSGFSWKVQTGWERNFRPNVQCEKCGYAYFQGGLGYTIALAKNSLLSPLLAAVLQHSEDFQKEHTTLATKAELQWLGSHKQWTWQMLLAQRKYQFADIPTLPLEGTLQLSYAYQLDHEFRLTYQDTQRDHLFKLGYGMFF